MTRIFPLLLVGTAFLALIFGTSSAAPFYAWWFPTISPPVYDRGSFAELALSHIGLVAAALLASGITAVAAAIFATRPAGTAFRPMLSAIATIGQSFPPAAVLAVLVPITGFGARPTFLALALYGLLPIFENTLAGIENVPAAVREAASGIGFSAWQRLWQVELPLARPLMLSGLRIATVVGLGTATIGSTVGALTLGTPIIDGLVSNKPNFVLQGALPLALLAVFLELAFEWKGRPEALPLLAATARTSGALPQAAGARRPQTP